jgi:hypothetical protein
VIVVLSLVVLYLKGALTPEHIADQISILLAMFTAGAAAVPDKAFGGTK